MKTKQALPYTFEDEHGNVRTRTESEVKDGKLFISYYYVLEEGKTTLRGAYPKLASNSCVFPARLCCDHGDGFSRCEFMKHQGGLGAYGSGAWNCTAPELVETKKTE